MSAAYRGHVENISTLHVHISTTCVLRLVEPAEDSALTATTSYLASKYTNPPARTTNMHRSTQRKRRSNAKRMRNTKYKQTMGTRRKKTGTEGKKESLFKFDFGGGATLFEKAHERVRAVVFLPTRVTLMRDVSTRHVAHML
eukprot:3030755-Rhodomonas_salina.2